jgi:hypothetical protein
VRRVDVRDGRVQPQLLRRQRQPRRGCEYGCIASNGGVEVCDARDNDCDGTIDDGNPGGGVVCGTNQGECAAGTTACSAGALSCQGAVVAVAERCNNLDDDCNGVIDNGFDKLRRPLLQQLRGRHRPTRSPAQRGARTVAQCWRAGSI